MTLIIYGPAFSSYVRTVALACLHKGVSYELAPVPGGGLRTPEHLALNPFGKIPVMRHNDVVIYESSAICRYIEAAFEGPSLYPKSPKDYALAEQWISAVNCYLDPLIVRKFLLPYAFPQGPNGEPDRATIDAALPGVITALGHIENGLNEHHLLAGETVSAADFFIMPMLKYLSTTPEGPTLLSGHPKTAQALQDFLQRPIAQKILV